MKYLFILFSTTVLRTGAAAFFHWPRRGKNGAIRADSPQIFTA